MSSKHLHIISFDIPFPADYGGVIDVFFKIKTFSALGIQIHLHCFEYNRTAATELNKYCYSVNYYPRSTGILSNLSLNPYIIQSRISNKLIQNLQVDTYPILCEGMHSCGILQQSNWQNRKVVYRESNVEHQYYHALAKSEKQLWRKLYYQIESLKLRMWETNLSKVNQIITVSHTDEEYYRHQFPNIAVETIFPFYEELASPSNSISPTTEKYILFHGNLKVQENIDTSHFIIEKILPQIPYRVIIAGKEPAATIYQKGKDLNQLTIIANPNDSEMKQLISNAQINLLVTEQATGVKLKLINALSQGKFCIANRKMLVGTKLDPWVSQANTAAEIILKIEELMQKEFSEQEYLQRQKILDSSWRNKNKALKMIDLLFS